MGCYAPLTPTVALIGKTTLHPHTLKPHRCFYLFILGLLSLRSALAASPTMAQLLWEQLCSEEAVLPMINRSHCGCVFVSVRSSICALASSVLLFMLRPMTHATGKAKRQTRPKPETTGWAGEQGESKWLSLTSVSALIHYRLYMSKRLPSVDSVESVPDAFVRLLSPKAGQPFPPSLPTLSTVI